jgi:hypothetical protein
MGIHLLSYAPNNERTGTHDAICDTFTTIARKTNFNVGQKQLYVLPSTTFNSFHWQIHIMFTKHNIHTLTNVVIIDPTWMDLFPRFFATQRFVAFDAAQAKERSYHN